MDASTIMPRPMINPVRLIVFRVSPPKCMASRVIRIEIGIEIAMMNVALKLRRKMNSTSTASSMPWTAELYTSSSVALTRVVSSDITSTFTPGGRDPLSSFSAACTSREICTALLSLSRTICTLIPRAPSMNITRPGSASVSRTSARSDRRTTRRSPEPGTARVFTTRPFTSSSVESLSCVRIWYSTLPRTMPPPESSTFCDASFEARSVRVMP